MLQHFERGEDVNGTGFNLAEAGEVREAGVTQLHVWFDRRALQIRPAQAEQVQHLTGASTEIHDLPVEWRVTLYQ